MTPDTPPSMRTQLPYEYYSLGFCTPETEVEKKNENLGQILAGDMQETSAYELKMKEPESCKVVCRKKFTAEELKKLHQFIDEEYRINWIIDNLPGAVKTPYDTEAEGDAGRYRIERGFPIGFSIPGEKEGEKAKYAMYNHIHFKISYHHDVSFKGARVVRFELTPYSVKHAYKKWDKKKTQFETCSESNPVKPTQAAQFIDTPEDEVVFTYDVEWEQSDVRWGSRWDIYFEDAAPDDQIHWFSIINSLMIVLFLTGMVAMIMMRTLHRDIARYNEEATAEEVQEETGWKLVHGDVFRAPSFAPNLFAVLVGSGVQIFMMTIILMIFAVLGFLSPANRGGLATAMLLLFVFMGSFAGYYSSRLYKYFQGKHWKTNTLLTAFLFPGTTYAIFFFLNLFVWGAGSSGAIPFGTLVALICLWFGISIPLVFLGSYFGFKKEEITSPVRTNQIPRQVPEQAWYLHPVISIAIGGVLPFGAVFIELFFIMSAVWLHQVRERREREREREARGGGMGRAVL
jgi:transmembrane 9 superfamily protein 2/4